MIESMKQALEALEYVKKTYDEQGLVSLGTNTAIIDLRQAIAEAEKQPKREWIGLTDEDFQPMVHKAMMYYGYDPKHSTITSGAGFYELVRAVEAKLNEKNT